MCFGHETGGSGLEEIHVYSATVMVYWRMCRRLASVGLYFFVSLSLSFSLSPGKSPAGPVCGITPRDPSGTSSQKRKQLSNNELLCFQRIGRRSWENIYMQNKSHTNRHIFPMCR